MFARRTLLLAVMVFVFSSAVGCCKHRCWKNDAVSYAPPPCNDCP